MTIHDDNLAEIGGIGLVIAAAAAWWLTRDDSPGFSQGFEEPWHSGNDPDAGVPNVVDPTGTTDPTGADSQPTNEPSTGGSGSDSHEPWDDSNDPDAGVPNVLNPNPDDDDDDDDDGTTWDTTDDEEVTESNDPNDTTSGFDDPWSDSNDPDAGVPNVL